MVRTPFLSTGSLGLDFALGGGIAPGWLVELYGPPGSGKTTLCLQMAAALGSPPTGAANTAWVDCDRSFDPRYAAACGVRLPDLLLCSPGWLEAALEMTAALLQRQAAALVVLDGLDLLPRAAELGARLDAAAGPPGESRPLAGWLARLAPALRRSQAVLVVTRQEAPHPGPVYHQLAGDLERLALPLHAVLRVRLTPADQRPGAAESTRIRAQIVKSLHKPVRDAAEFDIITSQGIYRSSELLDLAIDQGVIRKTPGGYIFGKIDLGAERKQVIDFLHRHALIEPVEQALQDWPAAR
ncbi:MAG: NACHT domain-containing protein [Chloroflexota bacterium]